MARKMKILITGAAGFIGQIVANALLNQGGNEVILTDIIEPPIPRGVKYPRNGKSVKMDLADDSAASVISSDLDSVIILHGIMSSGAESNLELGYRVNVDATYTLLFNLARACPGVRVLYASSGAVYGRPVPRTGVTERDSTTPEQSYGCQKVICEQLINDLTRRGKINGFALRFPTISVRPGKPTAAITSFLSGIIREPMNGRECVVPLKDRAWRHWVSSPKTLVHNILVALELERDALPLHRRAVNMPGFAVTVQDMLDALEEVGGKDRLALVREVETPEIKSRLYSWADDFDHSVALSLGMRQDESFVQSVKDYVETVEPEKRYAE